MTIVGDPEISRLKTLGLIPSGAMSSDREAMMGDELISAGPDEPTEVFHRRLQRMAKERGIKMVEMGHASHDHVPKAAPPYLTASKPADVTLN